MNKDEIAFLSVAEQAALIEQKEITPTEVVEAYLSRIEEVDPKLNSYITVLGEQALEQAAKATSEIANGTYMGPLHGIPVGIKDQIHTRGIRTSSASKHRENFVPDKDATVVTNLKKAGISSNPLEFKIRCLITRLERHNQLSFSQLFPLPEP